jgi:predicted phage terminase large subunit-like protein
MQEELDRGDCERSLAFFIRDFWEVLEPAVPLVWGWPIEAITDHLEAVTDGRIKRLIINVCPGFMKSLSVCVFWPAWEWGPKRKPHLRYINSSYSSKLTERDNRLFRKLVASEKYQRRWGRICSPSADEFNVEKVANQQTGWKMATSVSGVGTGARANRFLVDDANSVAEAESEAVMESTNVYMREVVPSRLNNMIEDVIVNIQQRTGENDATGTLLSIDDSYDTVVVPMIFDYRREPTSIGWVDPRTEVGELAWPERFPPAVVRNLERALGPYAWAGQYQQSPAPRGGGIFKRDWWQLWPPEGYDDTMKLQFPPMEYIVVSVDTAYTEKQENDYSACVMLGIWRDRGKLPRIMLMKAWQERLEFHALVEKVIETCRNKSGSPCDALLIEAKASGLSVAQEIRRLCAEEEFAIHKINPGAQDKVARAYAVQHLFSSGCVYAPDRKYADMVISNMEVFPKGKTDDLTDAVTMAMGWLRKMGLAVLADEGARENARELAYQPKTESIAENYGV